MARISGKSRALLASENESTLDRCQEVLQEVLEEWLILKIRDHDAIPRIGRVGLSVKAA
jgi:hypothetical protein